MPYETRWIYPGRILLIRVYGESSLTELREFDKAFSQVLWNAKQPIHTITDFTDLTRLKFDTLSAVKSLSIFLHPQMGTNVTVGLVAPQVAAVYRRVTFVNRRLRTHIMGSVDEGVCFLCEQDPTVQAETTS